MITQKELKERFFFNKSTGVFKYKAPQKRFKKYDVAGNTKPNGAHIIVIEGRQYTDRQLAWLWIYGDMPKKNVKLINIKKGPTEKNMYINE